MAELCRLALVSNETLLERWGLYTILKGYRRSFQSKDSCRASASACSTNADGVCFLGLGLAQPDWCDLCARNAFVEGNLT